MQILILMYVNFDIDVYVCKVIGVININDIKNILKKIEI